MKEEQFIPSETHRLWNGLGFIVSFFFLLVTSLIAISWISIAITHTKQQEQLSIFAGIVILFITSIAALALLFCMTIAFGRKLVYRGISASILGASTGITAGETHITSLFGFELAREIFSNPEAVIPQPLPAIPDRLAWSHIAYDNYNNPEASSSAIADILEGAVWMLIATGCVRLTLRNEVSILFNRWKRKSKTKPYCSYSKENTERTAYWERALLSSLRAKDKSVSVFDWVVNAYGDTASDVSRKIKTAIHTEYSEMGLGNVSGKLITRLNYADSTTPARNTTHWHEIKHYISLHGSAGITPGPIVRSEILRALKNRESSD